MLRKPWGATVRSIFFPWPALLRRSVCALLLCLAAPLAVGVAPRHRGLGTAQAGDTHARQPSPAPDSPLSRTPRDWIVDASNNEIKALSHTASYLRYHVHTTDHKGDRERDTVETRDGTVARLIRKDGRPLTADEDRDERDRLNALLASPADFAKHTKDDVEGKKVAADLIRLLPDAMVYSYVPGQPQTAHASGQQIVLDYAPRPGWNPPTTFSEGLRGLRGRIWIDVRSRYVVRMEGDIFQSVNFGWGMLAHIYPGGRLLLEQRSVQPETNPTDERWIYTHFNDDLKVRAVLLKTLSVNTNIESSDYQPLAIPPTYQDAIRALLATPLPR